jgi:FMN phosphatase YigB (HAD superfamily)
MNTVIFDLDGTLLPMPDQDLFLNTYFKALAKKLVPYGINAQELIKAVWEGTKAMITNDGTKTNEERFWDTFCAVLGDEVRKLESVFEDFYTNEFNETKCATSENPLAKECIHMLKEKGYRLILATNPVFPRVATFARIKWAGLNPEDFELITTYENSSYCKPNLDYYREILKTIGKEPGECMMVGNDVKEDMGVLKLGMDAFLLKDCLINTGNVDISHLKQGNFNDLLVLIKSLKKNK